MTARKSDKKQRRNAEKVQSHIKKNKDGVPAEGGDGRMHGEIRAVHFHENSAEIKRKTEQKIKRETGVTMQDNKKTEHNGLEMNEHSKEVCTMFKTITKRYDLLNHVCSMGIDFWWRRVLVSGFALGKTNKILDMAAGTLDVSVAALKKFSADQYPDVHVTAGDICAEMLEYGKKKIKKEDEGRIKTEVVNALSIPYADGSFDVVSIAFGIRNVDDRVRALSEMHRVLTAGGQLHILEFSPVKNPVLQAAYYFYLEKVVPAAAKLFGENAEAYQYLGRTIKNFPVQEDFCAEIKKAGFELVNFRKLTFGIVTVYTAIRTK